MPALGPGWASEGRHGGPPLRNIGRPMAVPRYGKRKRVAVSGKLLSSQAKARRGRKR
jgi:hypothetical protein